MAQQQPDLQAILATLAQYSQSASLHIPQPPQAQHDERNESNSVSAAAQNNASTSQNASVDAVPADPRLRNRPQSRSATPSQPAPQTQPQPQSIIDPATITVWQDGLRCVTKIAAQNKMFEASIRRMMQDQRAHEMRWYSERQALKQAQISRSSSAAKALSILQSLNQDAAAAAPAAEPQSEEEKEAELARFDRKLYAAQQSMETAMTAELKGLGVPFFGTSPDLIVPEEQKTSDAIASASHPKWSVPVTEIELLDLKRKMVGHLEALYRD